MPAYIGDISAYLKPMQDVIMERFPRQGADEQSATLRISSVDTEPLE